MRRERWKASRREGAERSGAGREDVVALRIELMVEYLDLKTKTLPI